MQSRTSQLYRTQNRALRVSGRDGMPVGLGVGCFPSIGFPCCSP